MLKTNSKQALAVGLLSLAQATLPSCRESTDDIQENPPTAAIEIQEEPPTAAVETRAPTALAMGHTWSQFIQQQQKEEFLSIINTSLFLVRELQPEGNNPFAWRGEDLEDKEFQFYFTTSEDPVLQTLAELVPLGIPENTDAFTVSILDPESGKIRVTTALLLDRLFYEEDKTPRTDAFARTTVVLAHELYGNVTEFLARTSDQLRTPQTEAQRIASEINAFQSGLDFLNRLRNAPFFPRLDEKLQQDFNRLVAEEQRALENWMRRY